MAFIASITSEVVLNFSFLISSLMTSFGIIDIKIFLFGLNSFIPILSIKEDLLNLVAQNFRYSP